MHDRFFSFMNQRNMFSIEFLKIFFYACMLYLICSVFFFDLYRVSSNSMFPTLKGNTTVLKSDHLLVYKWPIQLLRRGDIVVFIDLQNNQRLIVKRIVALPGDEIYIKPRTNFLHINGKPYIDSFEQKYEWNNHDYHNTCPKNGWCSKPIIVPKNCYFVFGDNTTNSNDSRMWGWLPRDFIVGKVYGICFPFTRIRSFRK